MLPSITTTKKVQKPNQNIKKAKSTKRLETRRKIEDLYEEKRLREELELDY